MSENNIEKRLIGIVTPVGALRSADSAGCGEFLDLIEFAKLCANMNVGLLQLLPVNDTGYESSPYFALTAFALNPIYIKLSALSEAEGFSGQIEELRKNFESCSRFPYEKVARAKLSILHDIFNAKKPEIERSAELKNWIEATPWIKAYAVFRRLKEANDLKHWRDWKAFNKITKREIEALWNDSAASKENLFWAWVQFKLDAQFSKAAAEIAKLGIILEGDIPILMNEDSADVWAHPEYFNNDFSAGAPPDMYSPAGQNWGFPIYNWPAHEEDNFSWWKMRLSVAEKYFSAYRIDHVLGFFRIWASSRINNTALLGRLIPSAPIKEAELRELGYDDGRIRWIKFPHIPTGELYEAVRACGGNDDDARAAFDAALERIGSEELWLFKNEIKGEKDICALNLHDSAKNYLCAIWNNRMLQEIERGLFSVVWKFRDSRAWNSFSNEEKAAFEEFIAKKNVESEKKWESDGKKLLGVLKDASKMLPCAEDLGAVPGCVPRVLAKLKIPGLKVIRWARDWWAQGQPYIPLWDYNELSVCTPAVHDSSTLREWWEREADRYAFAAFIGTPNLPDSYNPGVARVVLKAVASAASRFRVFQIQDLLHLTPRWYAADPASERINVPGTVGDFNWTYRLPAAIAEIAADEELKTAVRELAAVAPCAKPKKNQRR
ncbi:MAG: 4-alpha-glucanotransferase [Spirochaetaceae bacterium]|jgi:4-alpha-glucanotransferase|nr:4-alpha-glucanotransferase [Spirochaetaceae bacterium]GMO27423.1 MAG: hypothetical protein Pg6A_14980 [Termitinemataceae bacterium]